MTMSAADQPLLDDRTKWHRLGAIIKQPGASVQIRHTCVKAGPSSISQRLSITTTLASPSTVRWSSAIDSAPSSWRAHSASLSHTVLSLTVGLRIAHTPAEPHECTQSSARSLASVGGGMAAGAAFAHPRAADARLRPIFLTHMPRKCVTYSHNEPIGDRTMYS